MNYLFVRVIIGNSPGISLYTYSAGANVHLGEMVMVGKNKKIIGLIWENGR